MQQQQAKSNHLYQFYAQVQAPLSITQMHIQMKIKIKSRKNEST